MHGYELLTKIYDLLYEMEKINCELICGYYYSIKFDNNKLIISQINRESFQGNNWGEIESKYYEHKIDEIKCNQKEYIDLLLKYIDILSHPCSQQILDYEYKHINTAIKFI